ncbi:MAG: LamG domain-containing protein [Paraglaciecola sp.]|nr:LamG domain-containing protein [Paraglaciecola sp.]
MMVSRLDAQLKSWWRLLRPLGFVLFCLANINVAAASTLSGNLTADDEFDVFISTNDNLAGTYLGSGNDWRNTYTFSQNLVDGQDYYFHIYAKNNLSDAGFLGQFQLSGSDHVFSNDLTTVLTNTTDWKVSKTGWSGYVNASTRNGNNGVSPWATRPFISASATWIWSNTVTENSGVYFSIKIKSLSKAAAADPINLAYYEFEQSSWSGLGAVLDSSGQASHGSAVGSATPEFPGLTQKSCQVLNVPINASSALRYGVDTGLDLDRDVGSKGTISFWYRSNVSWGSSTPRQLFDASTFNGDNDNSKYFFLSLQSGQLTFGLEDSADNDAVLSVSGLNYAASEWVHIAVRWDYSLNRASLYINGTLVGANNSLGLNGSTANFNTLFIGDNRTDYSVNNSVPNSANGQFDALRIYNFEQSSTAIASDIATLYPCSRSPLVFYQFEEALWSGTNSVLDSSGNNQHANPLGSVTPLFPTGSQKSCQMLDVPANTSVDTISAINTRLDVDRDIGLGGSISFWYKSNLGWSNGIARQLFDASNTGTSPNKYFYLSLQNGILQFGMEDNTDKDALVNATGLNYAAQEWVHVAVTWDVGTNNMQIYLNGALAAQNTNSGLNGTIGNLNTLYFGDNRSTYIVYGSTGYSANGQFDDVRVYDFQQTQSQIAADAANVSPCIVAPFATYHFEQEVFSGAGSILDSSGNLRHASPTGVIASLLNTDQIACRMVSVPDNRSSAIKDAVDTQVDLNALGNIGTISFWYQANAPWNSGVARQLLDASTRTSTTSDPNKHFFLVLLGNGSLQFGLEDAEDKHLVATTATSSRAAGEWTHIAISWNMPAETLTIYVNGAAQSVTYQRSPSLVDNIADFGTIYLGDNRTDYFTFGSSANSANGQFDDLRLYAYAQTSGQIIADRDDRTTCAAVNHYRIEHDGQALTCESEPVIIKACLDTTCSALSSELATLNLSPSGWVGGNSFSFVGSTNKSLAVSTAGTYSFSKVSANPDAPLRCFVGGTETCNIQFSNAGFQFLNSALGSPLSDVVAETNFSGIKLRAVKDDSGVCKPLLSGNNSINLSFSCDEPSSCKTPLRYDSISLTEDIAQSVNLNFNSDGVADFATFKFDDAGQISLAAQAVISGVRIESGSSQFVVYPQRLNLQIDEPVSSLQNGQIKAAAPLTLRIAAVGANGTVLPNYVAEDLHIKRLRSQPALSETGSRNGEFVYSNSPLRLISGAQDNDFHATGSLPFNDGQYSENNAYYTETGVISLDVRDFNYKGHVIATTAPVILTPFIPAYYRLTPLEELAQLQNVHLGFSYIEQSLSFSQEPGFSLSAMNALNNISTNYAKDLWLYRPALADVNTGDNLTYLESNVPAYPGQFVVESKGGLPLIVNNAEYDGSASVLIPDASLRYAKVNDSGALIAPVEPFAVKIDLTFSVNFLTDLNGICVRDDYADASCNNYVMGDVSGANLHFGRFALYSAYGPENEALNAGFAVEHYLAGRWQVFTSDNETSINFSESAGSLLLSVYGSGADLTDLINPISSNGVLSLGQADDAGDFLLSAPGQVGEVLLRLNPQSDLLAWPKHLNFDWNGDGQICNQTSSCSGTGTIDYPSSVLSFGLYRGNDRVIQWREVFN